MTIAKSSRGPIERSFFERPPDQVAHDLIGAVMIVRHDEGSTRVRLVETEAYGGEDDPASHAFRGRTARNDAMFGPAGHLYVYRIYGLHWCMNVVTQRSDLASAVLLRGAEPLVGSDDPRGVVPAGALAGPGRLTRYLGVTGDDDGRDCCVPGARVTFEMSSRETDVRRSGRVGISRARERLSRYYLAGSPGVSTTLRSPHPEDLA